MTEYGGKSKLREKSPGGWYDHEASNEDGITWSDFPHNSILQTKLFMVTSSFTCEIRREETLAKQKKCQYYLYCYLILATSCLAQDTA
jgi:hypothetical protein